MMQTLISERERMKKTPYGEFIKQFFQITRFDEQDQNAHYTQVQLIDVLDEFGNQISEDRIGNFIKRNCPVPFYEQEFRYLRK